MAGTPPPPPVGLQLPRRLCCGRPGRRAVPVTEGLGAADARGPAGMTATPLGTSPALTCLGLPRWGWGAGAASTPTAAGPAPGPQKPPGREGLAPQCGLGRGCLGVSVRVPQTGCTPASRGAPGLSQARRGLGRRGSSGRSQSQWLSPVTVSETRGGGTQRGGPARAGLAIPSQPTRPAGRSRVHTYCVRSSVHLERDGMPPLVGLEPRQRHRKLTAMVTVHGGERGRDHGGRPGTGGRPSEEGAVRLQRGLAGTGHRGSAPRGAEDQGLL